MKPALIPWRNERMTVSSCRFGCVNDLTSNSTLSQPVVRAADEIH